MHQLLKTTEKLASQLTVVEDGSPFVRREKRFSEYY